MDALPEDPPSISHLIGLIDKCEHILTQHREDNPDLYRLVDLKREQDRPSPLKKWAIYPFNDRVFEP